MFNSQTAVKVMVGGNSVAVSFTRNEKNTMRIVEINSLKNHQKTYNNEVK